MQREGWEFQPYTVWTGGRPPDGGDGIPVALNLGRRVRASAFDSILLALPHGSGVVHHQRGRGFLPVPAGGIFTALLLP